MIHIVEVDLYMKLFTKLFVGEASIAIIVSFGGAYQKRAYSDKEQEICVKPQRNRQTSGSKTTGCAAVEENVDTWRQYSGGIVAVAVATLRELAEGRRLLVSATCSGNMVDFFFKSRRTRPRDEVQV